MAGLAHDASHFFKFLFILVLYTLVMTLFVRPFCMHMFGPSLVATELPSCNTLPQWGYRNPYLGSRSVVPDDLCWILCSPDIHSTSTTVVAMVMSSEGKILLLAIPHAYSQPSTTQYTLEALSVNEVGSGLMIVDELQGVPLDVSASLIMQIVRVSLIFAL